MANLSPAERLLPKRPTCFASRWQRWPLGGLVGLCCAAGTAAHAADVDVGPGIASTPTSEPESASTPLSGPTSPSASPSQPFSLGGSDVRLGNLRALVTGLDSAPA